MYPIYKKLLGDYILNASYICQENDDPIIKYFEDVPYVVASGKVIPIEWEINSCIQKLFINVLHLFDLHICLGEIYVRNDGIFIEGMESSFKIFEKTIKCYWLNEKGMWIIFMIGDLPIYEIVDDKLNRLLLLLLVDPLAFISRMRCKIGKSSLGIQKLFGAIEDGINSIVYKHVVKYWSVKQLGCQMIVDDVVLLIIDSWMALEILDLEWRFKI